jgi:hypothetical protein
MTRLAALPAALVLVACAGSSPKPAAEPGPTSTTSAALTAEQPKDGKTAAEKWAESKMEKEAVQAKASPKDAAAIDPLADDSSAIPKVELTPKGELRGKGRGDLDAAINLVKTAATVDEASKKLVTRLGKPTWIENGQKRVWVANDGNRCHRLVLEADGTVSVETSAKTDWTMLGAMAKQNACTGEIQKGSTGR